MQVRNEIIGCTVADIRALAPLVKSIIDDPYIAVMGSEDKIERDKGLFDQVLSMPN